MASSSRSRGGEGDPTPTPGWNNGAPTKPVLNKKPETKSTAKPGMNQSVKRYVCESGESSHPELQMHRRSHSLASLIFVCIYIYIPLCWGQGEGWPSVIIILTYRQRMHERAMAARRRTKYQIEKEKETEKTGGPRFHRLFEPSRVSHLQHIQQGKEYQ